MKKSVLFQVPKVMGMAFVLIGLLQFSSTPSHAAPAGMGVSFQVFYDQLMPYGDWVNDPNYGYIWIPNVGNNFQPYATNGHWVMTPYGNTWVSNYDWGWAPFHYGRWFYDEFYGWAWVPGYDWGPAWVSWRNGGGYYGWAPLLPGLHVNVAINIPSFCWVFVPQRRFMSRNVYRYYMPRRNVNVIYQNTTIINNTYVYNNQVYYSGPNRREIERVSRTRVPVYNVSDSRSPGRAAVGRNTVQVYRPEISRNSAIADSQTRPSRVVSATEYRSKRSDTNNNSNVASGGRNTSPYSQVSPGVSGRTNTGSGTEAQGRNPQNTNAERNRTATRPNTDTNNSGNVGNRTQAPNNRQANPVVRQNPTNGNNQRSMPPPNVSPNTRTGQQQPTVRNSEPARRQPAIVRENPTSRQQPANVRTNPATRQQQPSQVQSGNANKRVQSPASDTRVRSSQPASRSSAPKVESRSNNRSSSAPAGRAASGNSPSQGRRGSN